MNTKRPVVPHPTDPTLALVELSRGRWALIDAADAEAVGQENWCVKKGNRTDYAIHWKKLDGRMQMFWLHRFIAGRMGIALDVEVDHENGNGLDCTRKNLRRAEHWQNAANTGTRSDNRSGVKGVSWDPSRNLWRAHLRAGCRQILNKRFAEFDDAVTAVAEARAAAHGDFANHGTRKELLQ